MNVRQVSDIGRTMKGRRFVRGSLAVAVVLVVVASGWAALGAPPSAPRAAASSGTAYDPVAVAKALGAKLTGLLADIPLSTWEGVASMTDAQIRLATSGTAFANLTPAAVRTFVHNAFVPDVNVHTDGFLDGVMEFCGLGGGTGAGLPMCVLGVAESAIAILMGEGAASEQQAVELQFMNGEAAQWNNDFVYTDGLITLAESVLNSTFSAFASMADAVATTQLPNVTFDVLRNMNESGVAWQQATLVQDYANALGAGSASFNAAIVGSYASGGGFSSGCHYAILTSFHTASPIFGCQGGGPQRWYQSLSAAEEVDITNGTGLQVNPKGHAWIACSGGSPPTAYFNVAGGGPQFAVTPSPTTFHLLAPTFSAVWRLNYVGGTCQAIGTGIIAVPLGAGSPTTQIDLVGCGQSVQPNATPCDPTDPNLAGSFATAAYGTFANYQQVGGTSQQSPTYTAAGTSSAFFVEENSLMITAETNAKTYWAFLRILGYTSASQIPSNCVIPYPSMILPPQYDAGLGTLTLNQSLSLFSAVMNGLATFFNTPENTTTFCQGHQPFRVDYVPWNLNVVVTGFVYTLPKAHQNFGDTSTWTVTNASTSSNRVGNKSDVGLRTDPTPLVIWPEARTLYVPVGKTQLVPVDDPLALFVPANGTFYGLVGNGSAAGTHGFSNGTAPATGNGTAIFIATCQVRNATGVYQNPTGGYCPLTLSSILNVTFNTSCFAQNSQGGCGNTPFLTGGGGPCGVDAIWLYGGIVDDIRGAVGNPLGLGCFIAETLGAILVGILFVILIYVAYLFVVFVVRLFRNRSRGGGGGSSSMGYSRPAPRAPSRSSSSGPRLSRRERDTLAHNERVIASLRRP